MDINPYTNPDFYKSTSPNLKTIIADKELNRFYVLPSALGHSAELFGDAYQLNPRDVSLQSKMKDALPANFPMIFNAQNAYGYGPLTYKIYEQFISLLKDQNVSVEQKQVLLGLMNVKYILNSTRDSNNFILIKNETFLPRAFLVPRAKFAANMQEIYQGLTSFDPKKEVIIVNKEFLLKNLVGKECNADGDVVVTSYTPDEINLKVTASDFAYVVLSDLIYPDWYAFIDGKNVPLFPGNFLFRCLITMPGTHNIKIIYRPVTYKIGSIISLSSISLFTLLFIFSQIFIKKTRWMP